MWEWLKNWWQGEKRAKEQETSEATDYWQLLQQGSERQQQQAALALLRQGEMVGLELVLELLRGRDPLRSLEALEALLSFPRRNELADQLWERLSLSGEEEQSRLLEWASRAGLASCWLERWLTAGKEPTTPFCALAASWGDERYASWLQLYWQQQPDWQRAGEVWQWACRLGGSWPDQVREWLLPWIAMQPDNRLRRSWYERLKEAG